MQIEPISITLKDGRTATLRNGKAEDAAAILRFLRTACEETDFLLRSRSECDSMTEEGEARWITGCTESPDTLMLVCEVDGEVAGNCEIVFNRGVKTHHRANIGIALMQRYWGLGIGSAMFRQLIAEAKRRKDDGVRYAELEFIEGNSRARALYEKMGFRIVGMRPNAFILRDGSVAAEYIMQYEL